MENKTLSKSSLIGCSLILIIAGNYLLVKELQPYFVGYFVAKMKDKELSEDKQHLMVKPYPVKYLSIIIFTFGMLTASVMMNKI